MGELGVEHIRAGRVFDDPRTPELLAADARLCAAGSPFEVVTEQVLGETVSVFARRPRSLRHVLQSGAQRGDADCYVSSDGRRVTFAGLEAIAATRASQLVDRYGLRPGSRVALAAANSLDWMVNFWAVTSMGAVVVAMNGWWTAAEMVNAMELTQPALLLLDEKRRQKLGAITLPWEPIDVDLDAAPNGGEAHFPGPEPAEDDPAVLLFTSGTTGRPKAAVVSHRALIAFVTLQTYLGARSAVMAGGGRPGASAPTVRLSPFPLFHVSGLGTMISTLTTGAKSVWPVGRFDGSAMIRLTLDEHVTVWSGSTAHILRLLDSPDIDQVPPEQITAIAAGGSATPPEFIRRVAERYPHLRQTVNSGYGSTETGGLVSFAPHWMLGLEADCVGPALPTVSIRITDDDGAVVSEGVEGNVEARSPHTMLGYWDRPGDETVRPGRWIQTGDYGRIERDILYLVSRRRDLIIRGGENVYPFEIENRLCEHPGVREAAVIGVADPTYGQLVKAVVVLAAGAPPVGESELRAFCAETLAYYKVPEVVEISARPLPRNASGKVLKRVLESGEASGFADEEE